MLRTAGVPSSIDDKGQVVPMGTYCHNLIRINMKLNGEKGSFLQARACPACDSDATLRAVFHAGGEASSSIRASEFRPGGTRLTGKP